MTVEQAQAAVERIREMAGDDEAAHVSEDDLHDKVLEAIASGAVSEETAQELARIALLTEDIEFHRWYA